MNGITTHATTIGQARPPRSGAQRLAIPLIAALVATACASGPGGDPGAAGPAPSGTSAPATAPAPSAEVVAAAARADSLRQSWTEADVAFATDMIHHHAQALIMADMAPSHGASASLQVLAGRIINAQHDEIALMQRWLRDRGQPVPDPAHAMHGAHHPDMPGMLTAEQIERLDAARGPEFERLFLTYMIQHHEGAVTMVDELFATYGAAQGDEIFRIASDIGVDQRTEIERMRLMLRDLLLVGGTQ